MESTFARTYSSPAGTVLHARAPQHHWAGEGSLSIKTFPRGKARYTVGRNRFGVGEGQYLVLNHGQPYQIEVGGSGLSESFCLFFNPGFVEEVWASLKTPSLEPAQPSTLLFPERTYNDSLPLIESLEQLRHQLPETGSLEEQFHGLAEELLYLQLQIRREISGLGAAKPATRYELYRRLHRAKEFIASCYQDSIALEQIASIANLSPNHLLRNFKRLFGLSPHQMVIHFRLERAKHLLTKSDLPISQVYLEVGFESLGSFSTLFKQRFGVSPSDYRKLQP